MLTFVMDDSDVSGREGAFVVRRVFLPTRGIESFTVIGPDLRPVELVDEYLAWLTDASVHRTRSRRMRTICVRSGRFWPSAGWLGIGSA